MTRVLRAFVVTVAVMLVAGVVAPGARAATITVDTTSDPQLNDGSCSLRNAIVSANTDTAVNGCAAGSGADTIVLGIGVYLLSTPSVAGDTTGLNGDLDILHATTIAGVGSGLSVISGDSQTDRIFDIQPSVTAAISGVGLEYSSTTGTADASPNGGQILVEAGARLTLSSSSLFHGSTPVLGGGIYSAGTLTVVDSVIRQCTARDGGAIASSSSSTLTVSGSLLATNEVSSAAADAFGGAIYISSNERLNANGSTFQRNRAGQDGGAIYTNGPLTLTNDAILDNFAGRNGGGVFAAAGATGTSTLTGDGVLRNTASTGTGGGIDLNRPMTITTSRIDGNSGAVGGGVSVEPVGNLIMNRSTVSNNDGANASTGNGDGIYNVGNATLTNVTVSGNGQNTAKGQGGGIYNTGSLTLLNSTIAMNEASFQSGDGGNIYNTGSATAHDTIIADALTSGDCGGSLFNSTGNNLKDGDTTACFVSPQPSDLIADPQIGPLQSNGGPTKTHAIPASSPAKDAGATCSTIDQRGVGRPQGPVCDIGAYEFALCGTAVVNVVGTSGNDTLNGTSVGDGILGLNGNDTINGNGGNDSICPGAGNDTANGGAGNDTFFLKDGVADSADGGTGTDTATIDNGIDSTTNMEVIH